MTGPGRCCPLHYRYDPAQLRQNPLALHDTVYVVGGLYGNIEALRTVERMREGERHRGVDVSLVFNGDFNWFDRDLDDFIAINETVLQHVATQGNVEAELAQPDANAGCGCAYPPYVDDITVEYSNAIMARLQDTAARVPALRSRLAELPLHCTLRLAGRRIGVLHGDPESLAGWRFAIESIKPASRTPAESTSAIDIDGYFRNADVDVFACSHTCLPFMRDFVVGGRRRLIANNGAAGMPNFKGTAFGLLTRLSERPDVPPGSLYGTQLGALRVDALPIHYDQDAWLDRFVHNWPEGSPAHCSYFDRILRGPDFTPDRAMGGPPAQGPLTME